MKKWELESLKRDYPVETEVELIEMNDLQAPPSGTKGKVVFVDSIGTIHVQWENGSSLGLIYGEDKFKVITDLKEAC